MKTGRCTLAHTLGLSPLDRVQVADKREIAEMRIGSHRSSKPEDLPYMFFQRVTEDGRLEVRSPGGYATSVDALEVCDIIKGEPVRVQAMPRSVFVARLKLKPAERSVPAGPECYRSAAVRYVVKDRWGRIDQVFVTFDDCELNVGAERFATPIAQDDLERLNATATRLVMPVIGSGSSNGSADKGVAREQEDQARTAAALVECSLAGHAKGIERLAFAGAEPVKAGDVRKLRAEALAMRG